MVAFRYPHEAVYILENPKAQRVKVGVTGNNATDRLVSVNKMWIKQNATCQICGGRRFVNERGLVPKHPKSGIGCPGSNALPLEEDVALAESHLETMKTHLHQLSGSEKASVVRQIKTLAKRIGLYRDRDRSVGMFQLSTTFYTERAREVEMLSHKLLSDHLDKEAPFGEVFSCSVSEATEAVETALNQLGLLHLVRKEIEDNSMVTSEEYGQCVICGNNVTIKGACPDCMRRF